MRPRVQYYGWFDRRSMTFRVSRLPPDAPVRPSIEFASRADAVEVMERRRGTIMWSPPLHQHEMDYRVS
jgi:hypothetical protein